MNYVKYRSTKIWPYIFKNLKLSTGGFIYKDVHAVTMDK